MSAIPGAPPSHRNPRGVAVRRPCLLTLMPFGVILLCALIECGHAAPVSTHAVESERITAMRNLYDCHDHNDPLCLFCTRFAATADNPVLFPGLMMLREETVAYINRHVTSVAMEVLHRTNTVRAKHTERIMRIMTRLIQIGDVVQPQLGIILRSLQKNVGEFLIELEGKLQSNVQSLGKSVEEKGLPFLDDILTNINSHLESVISCTSLDLGDVIGRQNCHDLLSSLEECCTRHFIVSSGMEPDDLPVNGPDGSPSSSTRNMCHKPDVVHSLVRMVDVNVEDQLNVFA